MRLGSPQRPAANDATRTVALTSRCVIVPSLYVPAMSPVGSARPASASTGRQTTPSTEYPSTEPSGGGVANVMSIGHGSVVAPDTPRTTPVPFSAGVRSPGTSVTVAPSGTAPGCHVAVARPSVVTTAPACPATATSDPGTAAGIGAASTTALATAVAACEPPAPVAVTTKEIVCPISPGVTTYAGVTAPGIAPHVSPAESHRCH